MLPGVALGLAKAYYLWYLGVRPGSECQPYDMIRVPTEGQPLFEQSLYSLLFIYYCSPVKEELGSSLFYRWSYWSPAYNDVRQAIEGLCASKVRVLTTASSCLVWPSVSATEIILMGYVFQERRHFNKKEITFPKEKWGTKRTMQTVFSLSRTHPSLPPITPQQSSPKTPPPHTS